MASTVSTVSALSEPPEAALSIQPHRMTQYETSLDGTILVHRQSIPGTSSRLQLLHPITRHPTGWRAHSISFMSDRYRLDWQWQPSDQPTPSLTDLVDSNSRTQIVNDCKSQIPSYYCEYAFVGKPCPSRSFCKKHHGRSSSSIPALHSPPGVSVLPLSSPLPIPPAVLALDRSGSSAMMPKSTVAYSHPYQYQRRTTDASARVNTTPADQKKRSQLAAITAASIVRSSRITKK
jgi:hypothetical protein